MSSRRVSVSGLNCLFGDYSHNSKKKTEKNTKKNSEVYIIESY